MGDSKRLATHVAGEKPAASASKASSSRLATNGPLYMQTAGSDVVLVRRVRRKDEGIWKPFSRWFVENQVGACFRMPCFVQWRAAPSSYTRSYRSFLLSSYRFANLFSFRLGLSLNLLSLLFLAHACIPKARLQTTKFFHLSYLNERSGKYATGFDDLYLIAFFIVLFTGLRAGTMEYILAPFGRLNGITKRKDLTRFSEQAWLLIYYAVFWPTGVVRDPGERGRGYACSH